MILSNHQAAPDGLFYNPRILVEPVPDYKPPGVVPAGPENLPAAPSEPSLGIGYKPPREPKTTHSITLPKSRSEALMPNENGVPTLPTVTTWASRLQAHWHVYLAIALVIVVVVAYTRSRR